MQHLGLTKEELQVAKDMGMLDIPKFAGAKDPHTGKNLSAKAKQAHAAKQAAPAPAPAPQAMQAAPAPEVQPLRVAVVGSRSLAEWDLVTAFVAHLVEAYPEATFISGGAKGPDSMALWLLENKFGRKVEVLRADWDILGKSAGFARNIRLAMKADVVAALWDGASKGTKHTLDFARRIFKRTLTWKIPAGK